MVRRLTLIEFRTARGIPLSAAERDSLKRLHPGIRVEPTPGTQHQYDLTADQRIGIVSLPELVVEIRPKVPMSSVVFLISYACHAATWLDEAPELGADADLAEIMALMLARVVEKTTRRGLLNGYHAEEASLQAPRGRILFDEQLRRRLGLSPPVEVRHDVYTSDILENRLLLAALTVTARLRLRSERARQEVARAERLFGAVSRVQFTRRAIPDVPFSRLNRHYEPALMLASLVLRAMSLELSGGHTRGSAFLIDMNVAFEEFVRRALREALKAGSATLPDRPPRARLDRAGAVPLEPDLCYVAHNRIVWVGDAKYKRLPAGAYRNADLYQLLAYAVALGLPRGTLIYAADEGVHSAEHVVLRAGTRLRVEALDLTAPPAAILVRIRAIARQLEADIASARIERSA